jgi:hypothetical protein
MSEDPFTDPRTAKDWYDFEPIDASVLIRDLDRPPWFNEFPYGTIQKIRQRERITRRMIISIGACVCFCSLIATLAIAHPITNKYLAVSALALVVASILAEVEFLVLCDERRIELGYYDEMHANENEERRK